MSVARFKVLGQLDGAGGLMPGTVEIDREAGLFSVRPHGRRKKYTLPLGAVATMVCQIIVRQELAERRAAKGKGKAKKRVNPRRKP